MKLSYQEIKKRCLKAHKPDKPIYPRYVTHSISTWLIWAFQNAGINADTLTLASLLLAYLAIPFFVFFSAKSILIGAICLELYYVLDAVDGQWARLKQTNSLTGAFFDGFINYVIVSPIFFSIGWGLYRATSHSLYLLLGFEAGFFALWAILIWCVRAAVLWCYADRNKTHAEIGLKTASFEAQAKSSTPKKVFSILHKSVVFPWLMNVLTVFALVTFAAHFISPTTKIHHFLFSLFLIYYGITAPVVALALTGRWILTRDLDRT